MEPIAQKQRIYKMRMAIVLFFALIFHSCSIHKETNSTSLILDADRFYDYRDSLVYSKFILMNSHVKNQCKHHDTISHRIQVLAFSWNGYVGLEDFIIMYLNDDSIVDICTMDSTLSSKAICHKQLNPFFDAIATGKDRFVISDGYSFGYCQYIVVKQGNAIVFAQVSYGSNIYTVNKPKTVLKQIQKQYTRAFN